MNKRLMRHCLVLPVAVAMGSIVQACCQPPVAIIAITDPVPPWYAGQSITFDASGSYDPDGTGLRYAWTFYGGFQTEDSLTGQQVTGSYPTGGSFLLHLHVSDSDSTQCCPGQPDCRDKTGCAYAYLPVVGIAAFNADATKFPKCEGMPVSRGDFVIITNPTGYESQVEISGLTNTPSGMHTARATLNGYPTPGLPADYRILASGEMVAQSGIPLPPIEPGQVSASSDWKCRTIYGFPDKYERARVTWAGGIVWDRIGVMENAPPGSSLSVTVAKAWGISATVGVGIKAGVPGFLEWTFQASITGNWQESTAITASVSAPDTPAGFVYRLGYYQQVAGFSETVEIEESTVSINGPWTPKSTDTNAIGTPCGLQTFNATVEKGCP